MYYYFGILVLTVFSIGLVESDCNKENAQKILNDITGSESHAILYERMERDYASFGQSLFDCDDDTKLFDSWDERKNGLLTEIKKTCSEFEKYYGEVQSCREKLDDYYFGIDHVKYCSTFQKCSERLKNSCGPMKELDLLNDPMSNASVNFCTIECDNIPNLKDFASNCWAGAKSKAQSSSERFKTFSECLMGVIKPTCRVTKEFIFRIFPLFLERSEDIISGSVSVKPDSQCIKEWKALENMKDLKPNMCRILENNKVCIKDYLKGNDRRLKEKLAKCQYSVINYIRTEALHQPTESATQSPSTASGKLGNGTYRFAIICWLVTMVTYYFNIII